MSLWLAFGQVWAAVSADSLPDSELQALNDYPNWVGNCGTTLDDSSDSSTTPATSGTAASLDLQSIATQYNLQSAIVKQIGGSIVGSYQADQAPPAVASVLKLVIADVFLHGSPDLSKPATIKAGDVYDTAEADGKPQTPRAGQQGLTLKDMLQQTLMNSSDTDANVLIDASGGLDSVNTEAHKLGYSDTTVGSYYNSKGTVTNAPNSSTVSDLTNAMENVYSGTGSNYLVAQSALQNDSVNFSLSSEANKWGGVSNATGNSAVFKIGNDKYIITMYDGLNGETVPLNSTPGAQPIRDATNAIVAQLTSGSSTAAAPAAACACPSASDVQLVGDTHVTQAYNFFTAAPRNLTPFQAAVIVGTIMEESGHSLDPTDVNPSSGAYGIAQWLGGRLTSLQSFAQSQTPPTDQSDFATQLGFMWQELTTDYKGTLDTLKSETDIDTAVYDFEATYEVSGHQAIPQRQADAAAVLAHQGGGTGGSSDSTASAACGSTTTTSASGYQNPLRDIKNLQQDRIDQGVDYEGSGPVYAMGDGTVVNISNSGWLGIGKTPTFIVYKLSSGPAAGKFVYFAEGCTPKVSIGDKVYGGDATNPATVICDMLPSTTSDPNSIETGWADGTSLGEAAAHDVWVGHDSTAYYTAYGQNFSQLLVSLGAPPGTIQAGAQELGTLPSGWPTWQ